MKRNLFKIIFNLGCGLFISGCAPTNVRVDRYPEAWKMIDQGTRELRRGELDRAEASFRVAHDLVPIAAAVDGLGCVEFLRGNLIDAEQYFLRAQEIDPEYPDVLANLALLYETQGRIEEAREHYVQAIAAKPEDLAIRSNFSALISDYYSEQGIAEGELLQAKALGNHPIIEQNLGVISERKSQGSENGVELAGDTR